MLGVVIPYYKNSKECEVAFKRLMEVIGKQLNDHVIVYVYEDGQRSDWLKDYDVIVDSHDKNIGLSHARNVGIDYLIDKVDYIMFLDSDDMIDLHYFNSFLREIKGNYDILESRFFINDRLENFNADTKRWGVCGQAFKVELIKDLRFNETLFFGEDTDFMNRLYNEHNKVKKKLILSNYYYQYGFNLNSLMMRHLRREL